MTKPVSSRRYPLRGLPDYLTVLWPKSIEWAVSHLKVKRTVSGEYEATNPGIVWGIQDRIAFGKTRPEALRRARAKIVAYREGMALEGMFERKVLAHGLHIFEMGVNGWVLPEKDFPTLLRRVRRKSLPVYGIEAWRLHRRTRRVEEEFRHVKIHESYRMGARDPRWYMQAFEEIVGQEPHLYYTATLGIPKAMIHSWIGRPFALRRLREFWRSDTVRGVR